MWLNRFGSIFVNTDLFFLGDLSANIIQYYPCLFLGIEMLEFHLKNLFPYVFETKIILNF